MHAEREEREGRGQCGEVRHADQGVRAGPDEADHGVGACGEEDAEEGGGEGKQVGGGCYGVDWRCSCAHCKDGEERFEDIIVVGMAED